MLRRRILGAVITIVPLLVLLWLDDQHAWHRPGIWLVPLALLAAVAASGELCHLFSEGELSVNRGSVMLGTLVVTLSSAVPLFWIDYPRDCPISGWGWSLFGYSGALAGFFVIEMRKFQKPGEATTRLALSILAVIYASLPLVFLVQLRFLERNRWGLLVIVSILVVVKSSDAGAYFVGRSLGRTKMSPRLSPKKTWEGAAGGILAACLASWVYFVWLVPLLDDGTHLVSATWPLMGYGVSLAVAGMIGDLAESLIKRDVQTKDSGAWLPGLGGALDVLDSLQFAVPMAVVWWISGCLPGGPIGD